MVVTQPTNLGFGVITEATGKTFTIANTGKAELQNISVVSSNNTIFTVENVPSSLAAGESKEVTITMAATKTGALSSEITVSADGMTPVQFTVTGTVLPTDLSVIDFNDNQLPARWENTGWTFSGGAAFAGYHNPAYVMTTPKIVVNEGDMFVVKGKIEYNSSSYYVTVNGLDKDGEQVYSKKLSNDVFNNTDYTAVLLTDVPATVQKLQFVGYYCYIDEIQGINYAADLVVTTGDPAAEVTTPASYDFGESAVNADVTYTFTNAGTGTINITNVTITGDGAASYSTNWTESVAAPFDLKITRTYDATKAGAAQNAAITVTTSEGEFVINVTGTDKAANAPELAVTPNEDAAFGAVTTVVEKTYTVTNEGTGLLTVNIASDNDKFTVDPAKLEDIPAGESKTFKVIFTPVAETYGTFKANITVTPTYDETAVATITATAKVKDPAIWSESFADGELPIGWSADENYWTFSKNNAKASYNNYSRSNYLVTPTLTVSATDDELTVEYTTTANYVNIPIQYSTDGETWTEYSGSLSNLSNNATGTISITGLVAGNYQFRFGNDDYELDNFEGFKLNLPDHMAAITAYTIPASSSLGVTMKVGESFEATVTVKESRGVAEELTAKLYMGEEVIGTATGAVEANGTETLTITATPTVAATEGAQMHIEVEWAGATMKTEEVTRYVKAPVLLTLDESSSEAFEAGTYDKVTLNRTFAEGWNTIVLPFAIPLSTFGAEAQAYAFTGYTTEGAFKFAKVTSASLNVATPYVIYVPEAITEPLIFNNITISSLYLDGLHEIHDNVLFQGTYKPMAAGDMDSKMAGLTPDGRIHRGSAKTSIKGFRAYFDTDADRASVKSETAQQNIDTGAGIKYFTFDDATGIREVGAEADGQVVYNMAGQRIQKAQRGISIVNGKKIVVK